MDPEVVAGDAAAVKIARAERFGRAIFYRQERNIPAPYERPASWDRTRQIANLPSAMGIVSGPRRTVHPQTQQGSSWNFPPFTGLWPQGRPGGVINQLLNERPSPIRDRLIMMW